MVDVSLVFFDRVFQSSLLLADRLPLTLKPAPMEYIEGFLNDAVEKERPQSPFPVLEPSVLQQKRDELQTVISTSSRPVIGLNTVGMLLDRLSILALKHWNLTKRAQQPDRASELLNSQVAELTWALARVLPGHSSVNNKLTVHRTDITATTFDEAYFGLFTTNMLLWEAQEVLYNHDMDALPDGELRAYIKFFSKGNLARNAYIEASDQRFWEGIL